MWVLAVLSGIGEAVAEFFSWRSDWQRTWSPVSYWLAVITGLGLLIMLLVYGYAGWEHVSGQR